MRLHLFLVQLRTSAKIDSNGKTCYRLQNIDDYMSSTNFDFWQLTKPIIERFMLSTISTVCVLWSSFFQNDKRKFTRSFELYKYQGKMANCHAGVHPITGSRNTGNLLVALLSVLTYRCIHGKISPLVE